jgi:hypothetical protein
LSALGIGSAGRSSSRTGPAPRLADENKVRAYNFKAAVGVTFF